MDWENGNVSKGELALAILMCSTCLRTRGIKPRSHKHVTLFWMVLASNSFLFLTVLLIPALPANGTVTHRNLVYPWCSGGTELCLEGWSFEKHMEASRGCWGRLVRMT